MILYQLLPGLSGARNYRQSREPGGKRVGSTETRPTTGKLHDSIGYCVASLGLGSTARADILEGDACGAAKTEHTRQVQ